MSVPGPATEQANPQPAPSASGLDRFGPNSAEVAAFIDALGRLSTAQWRKVVATRRAAGLVTRDGSGQPADEVRALLMGQPAGDAAPAEPMGSLAGALAGLLEKRTDEEVVAAWQAASSLARRGQLAALTFAAHYVAFAGVIPPVLETEPPPAVERFTKALRWLAAEQWRVLARPWTLDREASVSLLQAALRAKARESEEAAALAALAVASKHLRGDAGWAAVKTAVHGGRVLGCRGELTPEQVTALWAPLEEAIALRSLDDQPVSDRPARSAAKRPAKARAREAAAATEPARVSKKKPAAKAGPLYGPNSAEVAAFVKAVPALTTIQWLRVLDRRQLVASVTRERSAEPAPVVRSSLSAIRRTRDLDLEMRCRVLLAVERAAFALESRAHLSNEQALQHYGPVAEVVPFGEVDAGAFAERVAALNPEEWIRLGGSAPAVNEGAVAPLVHAGDALADHLAERTDDEVAVTWQALTALVRRHQLSPIKFAVSYSPFASAIPVTKPKSITAPVQRYLTAIGRMSAHECALLAEPWLLADDVSSALSAAVTDGSARAAEEAAALAALVTVPMRLTGNAGWAAAKTVAFGARVIASRGKVSEADFNALWKPLERAIPIASIDVSSKAR